MLPPHVATTGYFQRIGQQAVTQLPPAADRTILLQAVAKSDSNDPRERSGSWIMEPTLRLKKPLISGSARGGKCRPRVKVSPAGCYWYKAHNHLANLRLG
jgi:hypothetical protein